MQTLSSMVASYFSLTSEAEYRINAVCKLIVASFAPDEVQYVEDFMTSLSAHDRETMLSGDGVQVAAVYEKMDVPVEMQILIEEVLNFALDNL